MCSGLMGSISCRPVRENDVYAVYAKGDIAALKEHCRKLRADFKAVVRENALLQEKLNRYERAACYGDDLEWTNEGSKR